MPEECRYRYWLEREVGPGLSGILGFICLNPSTADAETDDPTVRRMIGFARQWGYGRLFVANLFALRATDPRELRADPDPLGQGNDAWLLRLASSCDRVIAAWGVRGGFLDRDRDAMSMLNAVGVRPFALGITRAGFPRHPLYVPANVEPVLYRGRI